ncbi:pyruvate dehydrogenase (acetyl-transferring) E1 component subunit alpha [Lipingzhangella sp. LS1_29]|uniref:Pyruvate dehydrogenase (Acetyl-transferring) E1 component subunit alpha n=1 Tax=Lipingzhangella rawalii TaxID=2055835 RepID=A0ABU2H623_9ACTN|nr:pyruvate dehydrogenase (acetyl-transferring) E1 component subunit alpha [Lipingzhangella rawalii]MDS1270079.1 pyruvate dehydrogenase (acetyl-transferring) E1 component subunit alpha [Lipingzhangella rawalii]
MQLLSENGEFHEHPEYPLDLDSEQLRALYRDLVLVRRIDSEAVLLQRTGELGLWASLLGQEAAQVGSARALHSQDMVFPSYREHGVAWCRGVEPRQLLEMWRGVSNGGWDPAKYGLHLYTIVIGSQALHATGYAMGVQRDGAIGPDGSAVIAYFGDGATSQGDTNEAFVYAAVNNAPVVFFCQNNQWAISEPMERQSRVPLYQRAAGFGFPGVRIDGNDVLASLAVTRRALQEAREGNGPRLIEAFTYRLGAHTTNDDPKRYRPSEEEEKWRQRDPIARLRTYLTQAGIADEAFLTGVDTEAEELGERLRADCRGLPDPEPTQIFAEAYAEPHRHLERQRAEFVDYLASFEGAEGER